MSQTTHVTQSVRDIKWPGTTIPIYIHRSHCRNPVQFIRTSSDGETIIIVPEPRVEDEVNAAGALALVRGQAVRLQECRNCSTVPDSCNKKFTRSAVTVRQSQALTHVAPRRPFASSHLPPHHRQHSRAVDCIPRARLATPLPATPTRWHVSHLYRRAAAYNLRRGKSNNKPLASSQIKAVA
jgi:hypothetical protein